MNVFLDRPYSPMLIGKTADAFDSEDYIYELKLDGVRCLAYLDKGKMALVTRNGTDITSKFPELKGAFPSLTGECVIDGELVITKQGIPSFELVKERVLSSTNADQKAKTLPVTFVVFDLLYAESHELINVPLAERRQTLESIVEENDRLVLSRTVDGQGIKFFEAAKAQGLEGIVAKRKDSLYYPGKRTNDWVKCKNTLDDDFVIAGYLHNKNNSISLLLGQYDASGAMVYCGRVVVNTTKPDYATIIDQKKLPQGPFVEQLPPETKDAVWIESKLVCSVVFLERTSDGRLRHPVYQELRFDKQPDETVYPL